MAGWHRVETGETISSVAHDARLLIETVWNDPNNAGLRASQETWDRLSPGDNVYVRDLETKTESGGTEQRHRFKAKVQLGVVLRVDLDPQEASNRDDSFVLKSADGSYNSEKTIKDDLVSGDRFIDLHYSGLKRTKRYTLEVIPGEEGEPYTVFENVPYEELANLYQGDGTDFERSDAVGQVGGEDENDDDAYPYEPDEE